MTKERALELYNLAKGELDKWNSAPEDFKKRAIEQNFNLGDYYSTLAKQMEEDYPEYIVGEEPEVEAEAASESDTEAKNIADGYTDDVILDKDENGNVIEPEASIPEYTGADDFDEYTDYVLSNYKGPFPSDDALQAEWDKFYTDKDSPFKKYEADMWAKAPEKAKAVWYGFDDDDEVVEDVNGDGDPDVMTEDTDGDGEADTATVTADDEAEASEAVDSAKESLDDKKVEQDSTGSLNDKPSEDVSDEKLKNKKSSGCVSDEKVKDKKGHHITHRGPLRSQVRTHRRGQIRT